MTPPASIDAPKASRIGAFAALGCYSLWGFFPAFFPLLEPAGAAEIVAHRIVWSLVLMAIVLALMGQLRRVFSLGGKAWMLLALASLLVSLNWCV